GAVTMTLAYNGRIDTAVKQDHKPFKIVWDGQVYMYEWMGVPAGAKHGDEAKKILAFASLPEHLATFTKFLPYAPPRMKALPLVAKDRLSDLPTAPDNFKHALKFDSAFWVDHGDEINKRFMTWLAK
ncbi:MAG TPA: extracellular solute-binding protein, partial [Bordetella sp.]